MPRSTASTRGVGTQNLPLLRSRRSASGYLGVSLDLRCRERPWRANLYTDNRSTSLGQYRTVEEAARAVAQARHREKG